MNRIRENLINNLFELNSKKLLNSDVLSFNKGLSLLDSLNIFIFCVFKQSNIKNEYSVLTHLSSSMGDLENLFKLEIKKVNFCKFFAVNKFSLLFCKAVTNFFVYNFLAALFLINFNWLLSSAFKLALNFNGFKK